jgi:addiction module RelE/StbE family toxin
MFKLKYLPIALRDLRDITDYFADTLKAPEAAVDFLNAFDESLSGLKQFPYSCRVYQPIKDLETEYRLLPIKNYLVFYVVNDQMVEIHRVVYGKVDLTKLLK